MNSGMPIRDAVKKAIARGPPAVVTEKPQQSISREVYKSNNATRTKVLIKSLYIKDQKIIKLNIAPD